MILGLPGAQHHILDRDEYLADVDRCLRYDTAAEARLVLHDMAMRSVVRLLAESTVTRCDMARVLEWYHDPARKPAVLAFTEDPEREVATMIERGLPT